MTPKDYEIQNLRRTNNRLADELSSAMVGLYWLRGKYEEVEAQAQKLPEATIKGAELGILTYLSLASGYEPIIDNGNITFKAPVSIELLKAALHLCGTMDVESMNVRFEEADIEHSL